MRLRNDILHINCGSIIINKFWNLRSKRCCPKCTRLIPRRRLFLNPLQDTLACRRRPTPQWCGFARCYWVAMCQKKSVLARKRDYSAIRSRFLVWSVVPAVFCRRTDQMNTSRRISFRSAGSLSVTSLAIYRDHHCPLINF